MKLCQGGINMGNIGSHLRVNQLLNNAKSLISDAELFENSINKPIQL